MDVQLPHLASAGTSSATSAQSPSRPGQGGGRRESAGSGKSFSSELHEVHSAKEPRQETGRSQIEGDEHDASMSSNESAATTTAPTVSGTTRARDGQVNDRAADPAQDESDTVAASTLTDVTTQSVLLALLAQPIVNTDAQGLTQTSSDGQANTAMESVMPSVMEAAGTSLPVTAEDSSTFPQVDHKESAAKPADLTSAIQSGAVRPSAVDTTLQPISSPDQDTTLSSQAQPTPEELRNLQQEKTTFPLTGEKGPQISVPVKAQNESLVLPNDQRSAVREELTAVTALTAEPVQRPEDNRPVVTERVIPAQETPGPKEEIAPRQPSVALTGWQEPANQDGESGMEWSGHNHREHLSGDQVPAQSTMPDVSAPATPSNSTLLSNGMDHRAFSSAPSGKLPADAQPAASAPPVQPTDWMPGTSANQTKSMVLELSQADLGRVNIRVAVNQDTVHAHFSSERNEMGQYLVSGQDRLQSALNASGLDLGRFQVDIDRQSAGRSFQQPTSQEQSQGHTPQGESQNPGRGREEVMRDTAPRRGMLNLVA